MLSGMGGVATRCVKFCKRNCAAGFALAYLSEQSRGWSNGKWHHSAAALYWRPRGSPHLLSTMSTLWDLTVATSNLSQRLFLTCREFHWTSLSLVQDINTTLIISLLESTREIAFHTMTLSTQLIMNNPAL